MEDLMQLYELTETYPRNLEQLAEEWLVKLRVILWGQLAVVPSIKVEDLPVASPHQTKKRPKHLSLLNEEEDDRGAEDAAVHQNKNYDGELSKGQNVPPRQSKISNAKILAITNTIGGSEEAAGEDVIPKTKSLQEETPQPTTERKSEATNLMPPPPAPMAASASEDSHTGRPQRAAKLKSEKCLKEPKLNGKMRRPTDESLKVKLEHEQRPSQMYEKAVKAAAANAASASAANAVSASAETSIKTSISIAKSNESIEILPSKTAAAVFCSSNPDGKVVEPTSHPVFKTTSTKEAAEELSQKKYVCEFDPPLSTQELAGVRSLRLKIKREKSSIQAEEEKHDRSPAVVAPASTTTKSKNNTLEDASLAAISVLSTKTNTSSVSGKKARKKKNAPPHKPIKVERFSDLDKKPSSPIASRTRHGSTGKQQVSQNENKEATAPPEQEQPIAEEARRPGSVYEDAVERPSSRNSKAATVNETLNLGTAPAADATINLGPVSGDTTFSTNPSQTTFQVAPGQTTFILDAGNPNATVTLNKDPGGAVGDVTFDIHSSSKNGKEDDAAGQRSFETAKNSPVEHDDTLITEEKPCEPSPPMPVKQKAPSLAKPVAAKASAAGKAIGSAKVSSKPPTRTKELFNPSAQSPVKMRVEAFENAAAAAANEHHPKRPLRNKKENLTPTSVTTPIIGKLTAPSLGRFLTPTQSSNVSLTGSAYAKRTPTSASKALIKSASCTLQRSNSSSSSKTLQRENSADDFRRGLHNLVEERKRQREQKHLLAAQQREAKERERAERMAKLAKEKEEKRLQKQQELLQQKKRGMEEIQRKLRLQQEEEPAKEREMLMQFKRQQQVMSSLPITASKYTFEMLHEDDSTDDEYKVSFTRPPPPSWSRRLHRGPYVLKQEYTPSGYIDCFFSIQPMTPDLRQIFPNIDAHHLKRNSSVLWSTPPRYSELPKY